MMDRQHGKIVFECDACGDTLETGEREFSDAWDMAKSDGWRVRKIEPSNVWVHSCPKCAEGGR